MSEEENKSKYKGPTMPFYIHILKDISITFIVIGALITLAVFFPPELGVKADPFDTPEHIKPEWYFLAGYQFLKISEKLSFMGDWAPKLIGVAGQGLVVLVLFIIPLIDCNREKEASKRKGMIFFGIISMLVFAALTVWGHFS